MHLLAKSKSKFSFDLSLILGDTKDSLGDSLILQDTQSPQRVILLPPEKFLKTFYFFSCSRWLAESLPPLGIEPRPTAVKTWKPNY